MFGSFSGPPWLATINAPKLLTDVISQLPSTYKIQEDIAVHETSHIEDGAIVKGPTLLGPNSFVAAGAYLRGGVFLDDDCIVGPGCEVKTTFMFKGSKIAHLSFVGDSILGSDVNIEGGAMVANYRNEMDDKEIRFVYDHRTISTQIDKFGALIGDGSKIGANSVIAPGALVSKNFKLPRLGKIDQHPAPLKM